MSSLSPLPKTRSGLKAGIPSERVALFSTLLLSISSLHGKQSLYVRTVLSLVFIPFSPNEICKMLNEDRSAKL